MAKQYIVTAKQWERADLEMSLNYYRMAFSQLKDNTLLKTKINELEKEILNRNEVVTTSIKIEIIRRKVIKCDKHL